MVFKGLACFIVNAVEGFVLDIPDLDRFVFENTDEVLALDGFVHLGLLKFILSLR